MNEQDKQTALAAIAALRKHFVQHQKGQQLLTQIEDIINKEVTADEATKVNVPPKKRRGRPRKSDNPAR